MLNYLEKIIFLYIELKRKDLKLATDHPALVVFDRFSSQYTDAVLLLLNKHHVRLVIVPANCTDRLQPLYVSVNKAAKDFLRKETGVPIRCTYKFNAGDKKTLLHL